MTPQVYEKLWATEDYRRVAPGESLAYTFVEVAKPDGKVIDFGCGTGRGSLLIHALSNVPILGLDFAQNALDYDVAGTGVVEFRCHDLRNPVGGCEPFGYCTDVLEHIAPEDVDRVLANILEAARRVFLSISTVPDHFGPVLAGEPLHLTVKDPFWWHSKLESSGFKVSWSRYDEQSVQFYGTAWADGEDFEDISKLNCEESLVLANIKANLDLGLPEVEPHQIQKDVVVRLLAGGPSLADHEAEIVEAGRRGEPIVCVNGTYSWLLDRGIKPAAMVMVDAREFNRRFVERPVDTCRYLLSSQCDTELVKSLPKDRTWLWHAAGSELVKRAITEWSQEHDSRHEWTPIAGASTVVTRAVTLLAVLGYRKIEIFGWDSCLRGDEHHAYAQPENDSKVVIDVQVGERKFRCHPWMIVQANEFVKLMKHVYGKIPELELAIRGSGLIAAILEKGADHGC
jgi:SAM-dependent methyltransferase